MEVSAFYTIGHATREINEFATILTSQKVSLLVDVRSVPRSRKNPQFNGDVLPLHLHSCGIEYVRIPELGGFRAKSKTIPFETNAFWKHNSFHSYADYAMGEAFNKGLLRLLEMGKNQTTAIMCAEVLWWRCHRRIITDYLLLRGQKVFHITSKTNVKPASLSANARITPTGVLSYPVEMKKIEE